MTKIKPILPSLRGKKRYLVFEIISEQKIDNPNMVSEAILDSCHKYFGEMGMANAGLLVLNNKYNNEKQRGVIKVNNKMLNNLKASLCFVKTINGKPAIVKSVGVSGILKKAQDKFMAS